MMTVNRRFKVALSYPRERRNFVRKVAGVLSSVFGKDQVLFDCYHEAEFARPELDVHLPRLYLEQSDLIVIFLCSEYEQKRWCGLEWRHVRQLIGTRETSRIMLVSFGAAIERPQLGILSGDGQLSIGKRKCGEIAGEILKRVASNSNGAVRLSDSRDVVTQEDSAISLHHPISEPASELAHDKDCNQFETGPNPELPIQVSNPTEKPKVLEYEPLTWPTCYDRLRRFVKRRDYSKEPFSSTNGLLTSAVPMHDSLRHRDLSKLGIGQWSDIALAGLDSQTGRSICPLWATAFALQALGFDQSENFIREFLESLVPQLHGESGEDLWNRIIGDFKVVPGVIATPDKLEIALAISQHKGNRGVRCLRSLLPDSSYPILCLEGFDGLVKFVGTLLQLRRGHFLLDHLSISNIILEEADDTTCTGDRQIGEMIGLLSHHQLLKQTLNETFSKRQFTRVYWSSPSSLPRAYCAVSPESLSDIFRERMTIV